jgi:hypothetical protein
MFSFGQLSSLYSPAPAIAGLQLQHSLPHAPLFDSATEPEQCTAAMLLQTATHQAAGSLARHIRCITPHVARREQWGSASTTTHAATTSSSAPGAAAGAAAAATPAAAAEQEQQNLPHVSVLLQEVLHNLNHMPIKVRMCSPQLDGIMYVCLSAV